MTALQSSTARVPARKTLKTSRLHDRLLADRLATAELVAALEAEVEAFQESRRDTTTDDGQDPEGPAIDFERSQVTVGLRQARTHLDQIEAALIRMDEGNYGTCVRCADAIPVARLDAVPHATHCVRCAEHLGR